MNSMMERRCKKCLGCQAVTPVATIPPVKTTTMPTKLWRDLAVDLMGPLPTGESLLVAVDYYSRCIEVDVVRNTTTSTIIRCLENHFTRHGIPETLRTDNGPNLVSQRWKNVWTSWESNTRRQSHCGRGRTEKLKGKINRYSRQCARHKLRKRHGNENYRNIFLRTGQHPTPRLVSALPSYCTEGKSESKCRSSKAMKRRKGQVPSIGRPEIRMQRRKSEGLKLQIGELQSLYVAEEDKVLLLQRKQNKPSTIYDPDPYNVVSKKGDLVVIERGETHLKRNVGHVKRFIGSTPQTRQPQHVGIQPLAQPLVQQPITEPVTLPVPEPVEVLPQEAEPSPQPVAARVPERTSEPRRSMRQRNEPRWLKDYVT